MPSPTYKTGACREQSLLLPARVEDYVGSDNPVRAIATYVGSLDLARLGFRHAARGGSAGQPPYDPADLLKLYLYGYLNQIRSSRRLEREATRNVEAMWLLAGLTPGYRTIGQFRRENIGPLKQVNRDFVMVLRALGLVGGEMVAIDGAFFDGNASKASIVTRKRRDERLAALDREIEDYTVLLDTEDAAEAAEACARPVPGVDMAGKLAALLARRAATAADVAMLEATGQTQLSRTDADARLLTKNGQTVVGYNVQIAVDARHKLIVASDAVSDGNDTGQFHVMAAAAREAVGAETLQAVADCGYFNGDAIKACEESGIEAFVPEPRRGTQPEREGRFGADAFSYDAEAAAYLCPAGELLRLMRGGKRDPSGKLRVRYASRRSVCARCDLRTRCLGAKATRRVLERWEHQDVIARHRARMAGEPDIIKRRKALAEHPFGTLKCRAGYRHFLMRGLDKVRGELSLMVLCYNFTRVLNIVGLNGLMKWLAACSFLLAIRLQETARAAIVAIRGAIFRWRAHQKANCDPPQNTFSRQCWP
jgi:transposase